MPGLPAWHVHGADGARDPAPDGTLRIIRQQVEDGGWWMRGMRIPSDAHPRGEADGVVHRADEREPGDHGGVRGVGRAAPRAESMLDRWYGRHFPEEDAVEDMLSGSNDLHPESPEPINDVLARWDALFPQRIGSGATVDSDAPQRSPSTQSAPAWMEGALDSDSFDETDGRWSPDEDLELDTASQDTQDEALPDEYSPVGDELAPVGLPGLENWPTSLTGPGRCYSDQGATSSLSKPSHSLGKGNFKRRVSASFWMKSRPLWTRTLAPRTWLNQQECGRAGGGHASRRCLCKWHLKR
jgi:hypothetical protein